MKSAVKNTDMQVAALEKDMFVLKVGGIVLAVIGISAGGILWKGYDTLKEKEQSVFNDYAIQSKLQGRVIVDGGGFHSLVEYFK